MCIDISYSTARIVFCIHCTSVVILNAYMGILYIQCINKKSNTVLLNMDKWWTIDSFSLQYIPPYNYQIHL